MTPTWTIKGVLDWTRGYFEQQGIESPRLDAEWLIADALSIDRVRLYMDLNKPLIADELSAIRARVQRRAAGEPVAYINGKRGFWSLDLEVDPRALIPRPDTELLVEQALAALGEATTPIIADVGTGSGCVALALAAEYPEAIIHAVDVSSEALALARANAARLEATISFYEGDLLSPLGDLELDLVVSNPPYIPSDDIAGLMREVRDHEPHLALDGGPDGLDVIRRLIVEAAARLKDGGALCFEIGHDQGAAARALVEASGDFEAVEVYKDYGGHDRVIGARRRAR
ncbi:peptide chain release factor N(5)-glutamine methyltransferase [Myxococcota bacterium]|nr:peptide chain release factor N(5)-glutamine methyltransferase [Myxococcota bacterium]MBU1432436.1 peptide chain release factor N(5)-glutamine methyltransferase [Myxococcota bacterium]